MASTTIPTVTSSWRPDYKRLKAGLQGVLRIPLVLKIMGANGLIVAVAFLFVGKHLWTEMPGDLFVILGALALATAVNLALVNLALSPIADLERIAYRVSRGEFSARAEASLVADPQLAHLAATTNLLLESLAAERKRIQKLGVEVVSAQDTERARLSHDLHDSIAQTLAGVRFQLSAAAANAKDDEMKNALAAAKGMIGKAMDEVRNISQSLHPRIADDLGLVTALESLAAQTRARGILDVVVTADIGETPVPATVAATLFRVAQEALKNAELRPGTGAVEVLLYANNGTIRLEVTEDSHELDKRRIALDNSNALTSIGNRVALSGGTLNIDSVVNGGTKVTAELSMGDVD